jgi:hypothetical protein
MGGFGQVPDLVGKIWGEAGDAFQKPSIKGVPKEWQAAIIKYGPMADKEARKYKQPNGATLIAKVIKGESGFRTGTGIVSSAGAKGAGQFMPGTRAEFITKYNVDPWSTNIDTAVKAVGLFLRDRGLAAYNPGGGQGYINYILGQDVTIDTNASQLVPDSIEGTTDAIGGGIMDIIRDPAKLGALAAKTSAYFWRLFGKAMWDYAIAPPVHWTERAVDYYYYHIMSGEEEGTYYSYAGIVTMVFWGMGYGILWSTLDDNGLKAARRPRDSILGRTVQGAQLGAARRKLGKPGATNDETPPKPEPTETTAEIEVVRTVATNRRRAVTVSNNEGTTDDVSNRRGREADTGEAVQQPDQNAA